MDDATEDAPALRSYGSDEQPGRPRVLLVQDVRHLTGLGDRRIRMLDAELAPLLTPSGGRVYLAERVEEWLARRGCR